MQIRGGGGAPRGGGEQVVHGAEATKAWTEGASTFSEVNGLVCRKEKKAEMMNLRERRRKRKEKMDNSVKEYKEEKKMRLGQKEKKEDETVKEKDVEEEEEMEHWVDGIKKMGRMRVIVIKC